HSMYRVRSPSLMGDRLLRQCWFSVANLFSALLILLVERPDLVLASGTAQALPFALACKLLRRPIWFIESLTRVCRPSRAGNLLSLFRLCDRFYYHWIPLRHAFPRGVCTQKERS